MKVGLPRFVATGIEHGSRGLIAIGELTKAVSPRIEAITQVASLI